MNEEKNVVKRGTLLLPVPPNVPYKTREILQRMKSDEVYRAAINDPLIMKFAEKLRSKHYP